MRKPIFYKIDGPGQVYTKIDPYYVRSLERFSSKGIIPSLSEKQKEALDFLEEICLRESLHMVLEVGDIQIISNTHVLHARTAYSDFDDPAERRHLMRLWLSVGENEGGWALPFGDSAYRKRGGIQVDDTPETCPLDAE